MIEITWELLARLAVVEKLKHEMVLQVTVSRLEVYKQYVREGLNTALLERLTFHKDEFRAYLARRPNALA